MRRSKSDIDEAIIGYYKVGWSYRKLQRKFHKSPNYLSELLQGIEVVCAACGKPKGKVKFHAHHPDRVNFPDYTIPLCPSCHPREEAKLRREKEQSKQSQSPILVNPSSPHVNLESEPPEKPALSLPPGPLSPTGKKLALGVVTAGILDAVIPTWKSDIVETFKNGNQRYKEKKRRWREKSNL